MAKPKLVLLQFILIFNGFVIKTKAATEKDTFHCFNPNGRIGMCVSVYECEPILNIIKNHVESSYAFARSSECPAIGETLQPFVCCTTDTDFTARQSRIIFPQDPTNNENSATRTTTATSTTTKSITTESTTRTTARTIPTENANDEKSSMFPKPPHCGPVTIVNKIYGGDEAALGEFPWLANLEYLKPNGQIESVCAGNIINEKYILTAAHCVQGEIEVAVGKLVSLRVGVHNTLTPTDCNNSGCLDPPQRMGIAKIIAHPDYGKNDRYPNYNDIALIRTDQNMKYSYSVAAICLPDVLPEKPQLRNGLQLSVAGWGHTGDKRKSAVKLKVALPYVENEMCRPNVVGPEQLCAGGEFKKDSCGGDSGGGLTRLVGSTWIMEGIVSYGRKCGLETPAVYTRVSSYIPWIRANVEP